MPFEVMLSFPPLPCLFLGGSMRDIAKDSELACQHVHDGSMACLFICLLLVVAVIPLLGCDGCFVCLRIVGSFSLPDWEGPISKGVPWIQHMKNVS